MLLRGCDCVTRVMASHVMCIVWHKIYRESDAILGHLLRPSSPSGRIQDADWVQIAVISG